MKCTSKELRERIVQTVERSPLYARGTSPSDLRNLEYFVKEDTGLSLNFEHPHIWACSSRLSVSKDFCVTVSWSSTDRSPAMAASAMLLYGQVVDLAQHIQALVDCA